MKASKFSEAQKKEKLIIPLHPNLQAELARAERTHMAILATVFGKPFTVKGFGNMMADAIRAAGAL